MKKLLTICLIFIGCAGGGDDRVALEFASSCVFGNAEQSCADFELEGSFEFGPEGESNDLELQCEEQENGITIICGPNISIDTAIQNGDTPGLAEFLSKGTRIPDAPDSSELPSS